MLPSIEIGDDAVSFDADVARDKVGRLRLVSLFCSAEPVGQTPMMVRRCSMPLKSSSLRV